MFKLVPCVGNSGSYLQKKMYSTTNIAVGVGSSLEKAIEDAKSAIPHDTKEIFYEPDSNFNSPQYQCLNDVIWTEKDECWEGGSVQYVIPLRRVTR